MFSLVRSSLNGKMTSHLRLGMQALKLGGFHKHCFPMTATPDGKIIISSSQEPRIHPQSALLPHEPAHGDQVLHLGLVSPHQHLRNTLSLQRGKRGNNLYKRGSLA